MAYKTFHSSTVTFLDRTDERKLEVYITSNHPTVQIKNQNTGEYTPDWSVTNLQLTADIYLNSIEEIIPDTIQWYAKIGTTETLIGSSASLTINTNTLDNNPIITYICKVEYQGIKALSQITFSRTDTGLNGTDGTPAPAVQAQYSVDGASGWIATLDAATHKYIRYSYDGGKSWTAAIKMVGEDGTSVNIKGTATSKTAVSGTSYYTLVYDSTTITGAMLGDAYLLDGNMYVCVDSRDGNDYFMNVGKIQGPQGKDGQSSYVFIRYATDVKGSNMTTNPTSTTTHIGICTINTNVAPTTANSYTWSKFVGDNAKTIILTGSAQVFKISKTNVYTPSTISVTATPVNTSITEWSYSVNGGQTFLSTVPTGVVRNGNIVTITGSTFTSNSLVVKASDGQYSDIFTIYKAFDGTDGNPGSPAPLAFLTNENISFVANTNGQVDSTAFTTNVVAYVGTTKVTPVLGTISGLPAGMTVSTPLTALNEIILTFSLASGSTLGSDASTSGTITIPITSPISTNLKLNWSKINTGATGVGIKSTTVSYGVSDAPSTQPTEWQSTIPTVAEGKYLWTRTIVDYTDDNVPDTVTYIYAKQGEKGTIGNPGNSVTVSSIQYQEGASATTVPTGTWSNAVVAAADGKYLWTKTTFSDNKIAYGVAKQGSSGRGVSTITEKYLATTASSGVTTATSGWTETIQVIDASKRYLWNYEIITYTDGATSSTTPVVIGVFGNTGSPGKGIKSITEYYLATAASSGVTTSTSGWKNTIQTLTATNKYLWNYELITYTDNTTSTVAPVIIGVYGDQGIQGPQGNDAYTVILTNESHVFAGGISTAIASSATTQVLAYNGATSQSVTIVSVNGVAASTASTATGIAGLSFKCSTLSGTSPTITFTCTTAFVSPNGTIPIVIKVGSISITKMFTYSIAFKGATGGVGAPSSSYWLVANADAVQKTTSGDILCTPATVTFTGKIQTGTSAPTNYACRWVIAYTTDGTTYTDLYTSAANEASTSVAAGITYKALRARMYLAGGTATLLDEQIIPFVSDGAIGVPGNDAVTFQVYSSNGYALSTNTPTVTLQTFAYIGDVAITSGATYQWYSYNNGWSAISGATLSYLDVSRTDVLFSKSYMCKMIFGGVEYTGVATIDDKNDTNKVFTSKPSNYTLGDLWIVGMDYIPSGVEVGTLLRTEHTNLAYADSDWIAATKYDEKIDALNSSVDKYDKYFSFDSQNGLKISARDANGNASQFSTTLSNERLSFNQGTDAVAYIESNKMKIKEAEIISPLTVTGQYSGSTMLQAPIINIGNFSIVVESNGSLSIVANT